MALRKIYRKSVTPLLVRSLKKYWKSIDSTFYENLMDISWPLIWCIFSSCFLRVKIVWIFMIFWSRFNIKQNWEGNFAQLCYYVTNSLLKFTFKMNPRTLKTVHYFGNNYFRNFSLLGWCIPYTHIYYAAAYLIIASAKYNTFRYGTTSFVLNCDKIAVCMYAFVSVFLTQIWVGVTWVREKQCDRSA